MIRDQEGFKHYDNWYKGNLHSHTTNSDGTLTPRQSVTLFQQYGYHFLCLSDHDVYTDYRKEFDNEKFILLPGLEASAYLLEKETKKVLKVHHIHGILGTEEMQQQAKNPLFVHGERIEPRCFEGQWNGAEVAQQLSDYLKSRGCITTYNHPIWSRVEQEEFVNIEGVWALEIFNYNTVNESNTGYDITYWDVMLRKGKKIWAIATDDNHNNGMFHDIGVGCIMVNAPQLERELILQNMLCGNYYLSSGPKIMEWKIEHGKAVVKCSPVYRIDFIVGGPINSGKSYLGKSIEETLEGAVYELNGDETYIRVQCTDKYGKTAWSNPFYEEENDLIR